MANVISILDSAVYNTPSFLLITLGVLISIRFAGFPDLTVDGSYTIGAALYAVTLKSTGTVAVAYLFAFVRRRLRRRHDGKREPIPRHWQNHIQRSRHDTADLDCPVLDRRLDHRSSDPTVDNVPARGSRRRFHQDRPRSCSVLPPRSGIAVFPGTMRRLYSRCVSVLSIEAGD